MIDASQPITRAGERLGRHSERRSLILCGIGAIIGLVIAGTGLFTAHGTRIAGVPPEDVALVNQVPILMSDYIAQLRAQYDVDLRAATPAQKRNILDAMIREELYVQRGLELGLQNDVIEVRSALVNSVEGQQAVDAAASQPSETDLRGFYRAHSAKYATEGLMTLTDLTAPDLAQAQAAVRAIRGGDAVAVVRQAYGLRDSGRMKDDQEFYFAARIHMGPQLFDAASRLRDGQVSDPVKVAGTTHILIMGENIPPVPEPYEAVRDQVLSDFRADKVARMQTGADRYLRQRADIQIAEGFQ